MFTYEEYDGNVSTLTNRKTTNLPQRSGRTKQLRVERIKKKTWLTFNKEKLSKLLMIVEDRRAGERGTEQGHRLLRVHMEAVSVLVLHVGDEGEHVWQRRLRSWWRWWRWLGKHVVRYLFFNIVLFFVINYSVVSCKCVYLCLCLSFSLSWRILLTYFLTFWKYSKNNKRQRKRALKLGRRREH